LKKNHKFNAPDPSNFGMAGDVIPKELGSGSARPQELGCGTTESQELGSDARPRLLGFGRGYHTQKT